MTSGEIGLKSGSACGASTDDGSRFMTLAPDHCSLTVQHSTSPYRGTPNGYKVMKH